MSGELKVRWGSFTKGVDGLIVEQIPSKHVKPKNVLKIHGVIEVKSMALSARKVRRQINNHISRLNGGGKLGAKTWPANQISFSNTVGIIPKFQGDFTHYTSGIRPKISAGSLKNLIDCHRQTSKSKLILRATPQE